MNNKDINTLTIECLMTRSMYNKYLKLQEIDIDNNDTENNDIDDIIFYKKRIVNITKEFIKIETDNSYNSLYDDDKLYNLREIFNLYIKNLIKHFKQEDTKDFF